MHDLQNSKSSAGSATIPSSRESVLSPNLLKKKQKKNQQKNPKTSQEYNMEKTNLLEIYKKHLSKMWLC